MPGLAAFVGLCGAGDAVIILENLQHNGAFVNPVVDSSAKLSPVLMHGRVLAPRLLRSSARIGEALQKVLGWSFQLGKGFDADEP